VGEIRKMVREEISARGFDDQPADGSLSTTAENGRLRQERYEPWQMASAVTHYWKARLKFEDAISSVQRNGTPEGRSHPAVDPDDRFPPLDRYRAAHVKQLLTPAPDAAAVIWKQAALARGQHRFTDVKSERIERAIADDLAFLAAHPVRRSNRQGQG
jgi:hypothetical protein